MKKVLLFSTVLFAFSEAVMGSDGLLIDNFENPNGKAVFGTAWEGFTDRVMGGRSTMNIGYEKHQGFDTLHMSGNISLENNGGFIQARLPLKKEDIPFDAGEYEGIAVTVKGEDTGYYLHLRTIRTVFPWSYYGAEISVTDEWQRIEIPFQRFRSENMIKNDLNPRKLVSLGVVAAKKEFTANLYVSKIEFYR